MTIPEACQLVIQAGSFDGHGDVFILDMGRPVKIKQIAERMIALSGKPVQIRITGLREGEKIHEDLISECEQDEVSWPHEKIAQACVEPLPPSRLDYQDWLERCRPQVVLDDLLVGGWA
jgi:dTDP-glucose 4,6-dehydratase